MNDDCWSRLVVAIYTQALKDVIKKSKEGFEINEAVYLWLCKNHLNDLTNIDGEALVKRYINKFKNERKVIYNGYKWKN